MDASYSLEDTFLVRVNKMLPSGWQCKLNPDGRLYYLNHNNQTSHWIPPHSNWPRTRELPYGWESATDKNNKEYFINHRACTTTREDPFDLEEAPPEERGVVLTRDAALGFGFIAGSEKPVVVRSVTEGGPSIGKLLPGDEILKVNGEDVRDSDRQYIIDKIRFSTDEIALTVIQPYIDKTGLKSSFLSATKKQKLKVKPPRVRFAESVNTFPSNSPKIPPSLVYLPDVLKVYLENGQTKSFKYDDDTTVKDVLVNLQEKLGIKSLEYFALVVQDVRETLRHKFVVLQENETLRQIADRPGSKHWKCFLRVTFVPLDAFDLLNDDPSSFEYFFSQCCNDVLQEHFGSELKPDTAIRLAALHIYQHLLASRHTSKVSIKALEKDDSLKRFLPASILSHWKIKELRKLISQHMKSNNNLTAPGQKHLTALQAKLHYLKIVGELKSFGAETFLSTVLDFPAVDQQSDARVLVGPRCDVSLVGKTGEQVPLVLFNQLTRILLTVESGTEEGVHRVELHQKSGQPIVVLMQTEEAQQMAAFINGYYRLLVRRDRSLLTDTVITPPTHPTHAPAYHGRHHVRMAKWSYADDLASEVIPENDNTMAMLNWKNYKQGQRWVDLSSGPPLYQADPDFQRSRASQQGDEEGKEIIPDEQSKEQWEDSEQKSRFLQNNEKQDGEKEEDILSMLSSGASSPESDTSITMATDYNDVERATNGFNENNMDSSCNGHSSAAAVTLHHVLPTDKSVKVDEVDKRTPEEMNDKVGNSPSKQGCPEERPNSRLRARDSILIQHRKMSPMMQRRMESYESETEADSFDSDVIDLTGISGIDFGPDLQDSGDVSFSDADMDSVFVEFLTEGGNAEKVKRSEEEIEASEEQTTDIDENGEQVCEDIDDAQSSENKEGESEIISNGMAVDNKGLRVDSAQFENEDTNGEILPVAGNLSWDSSPETDQGQHEDEDISDDGDKCSCDHDIGSNSVNKQESIEDQANGNLCVNVVDSDSVNGHESIGNHASENSSASGEGTDGSETLSYRSDDDVDLPGMEEDGGSSLGDDICCGGEQDRESSPVNGSENATQRSVGEEATDEAHGMQLAALLALDASLEETEESLKAEGPFPSNSYESDSGNETISSEVDNNNMEQPPECTFRIEVSDIDEELGKQSPSESLKDKINHVSWKEDDSQSLTSAAPYCGTSSDTESTSTLHGSMPNLTSIDTGEDELMVMQHQNLSLMPGPTALHLQNEESLILPLPPPVECEDVDEELLHVVIPPPAMEGFDEGQIVSVFQQDTNENLAENASLTALEGHVSSDARCEDGYDIIQQSDIDEDATAVGDNDNNCDAAVFGAENESLIDQGKCLGSEDDLDEEAGLRELLEMASDRKYSLSIDVCDDVGRESPSASQGEIGDDEVDSIITRKFEQENAPSPQDDETDNVVEEEGNPEATSSTQHQKSPEQRVADILESIITGCLPTNAALGSSPVHSVGEADSAQTLETLTIEEEECNSLSLHSSVQDHVLQTKSPDSPVKKEQCFNDNSSVTDMDPQEPPRQQIKQSPRRDSASKLPGWKPNIPPKPVKPARPKDLKLKVMACEMNSSLKADAVIPVSEPQQPPQPPPRRRYTAPGIAAKASKFENFRVDENSDNTQISPRFQELTQEVKENEPQPEEISESINTSPVLVRNSELHSPDANKGKVARSHTFSGAYARRESNKLQPVRKAPPPPLPKPKPVLSYSQSVDRNMPGTGNTASTPSPHGSLRKKTFAGSLSRLLTPTKHKSWGQFRDSLPFKHGSLKGSGSSRAKVKSRKPLKALWPSATCDDNPEKDRSLDSGGHGERNLNNIIQRSVSVEFNVRPEISMERKTRSRSVNVIPSDSEESTSESDYGGSRNGETMWGMASSQDRPSSMISLTSSYPTAFSQPRKPPPPLPSNPPVFKAASLSRLTSPSFVPSGPAHSIFSTGRSDSMSSELSQASSTCMSPSPPPLPATTPPEFHPYNGLDQMSSECGEDDAVVSDDSFVAHVESKEYTGVTAIMNAIRDIELLTQHMDYWVTNFVSKPSMREFRQAKESLLCEVREFTSNTKMVVSAAGQTGHQLRESANSSMHTLARLCSATHQCMTVMYSAVQARNLIKKVEDIARNFSSTLQAANEACGKPLNDPKMQQLLRQAQTMAALLSALMRSLRMLQH